MNNGKERRREREEATRTLPYFLDIIFDNMAIFLFPLHIAWLYMGRGVFKRLLVSILE
ncbi:MAG: hypothetical protein ACMUIE_04920 [Thermoplasmatota archaeon]